MNFLKINNTDLFDKLKERTNFFFHSLRNKKIVMYVLISLVFVSSGYALSVFVDQIIRSISAFGAFLISFIMYVGEFDTGYLSNVRTKKRVPYILPSVVLILVFGFSTILTVIINNDFVKILDYLIHGLFVLTAFFVTRAIGFEQFKKIFSNIVLFLSVVSLFFFMLSKISEIDFGLPKVIDRLGNQYANYFFISFENIYNQRLQSIFWEPGLFSSFVLIALFFDIADNKKTDYFRLIIYTICIIFTQSTFAYFAFILIVFIYLQKSIRNEELRVLFYILLAVSITLSFLFFDQIITLLAQLLPSIFGKFLTSSTSITTRLYSPLVNIDIFFDNMFVGVGFSNAYTMYPLRIVELGYTGLIDAQTSTSTFFMSVFGLPGVLYSIVLLLGPLLLKKYDVLTRIALSLLFLIILNKEPHNSILMTFVFMFYIVKETADEKIRIKKGTLINYSNQTISQYLSTKGQNQSIIINLLLSVLIKGITLVVGFFSVRAFAGYFSNQNSFGVWLTILSIVGWVMTFDLGLGNGLKNMLIESFESKDTKRSKEYISSTYFASMAISLAIFALAAILVMAVDLNSVFNISTTEISSISLKIVVLITLLGIIAEFAFKNIIYIFHALQKQYLGGLFQLFSSLFLMFFALLVKFENIEIQLYAISIVFASSYALIYILPTVYFFANKHRDISPSIRFVNKKAITDVMGLGIMFFLIQLTLLFLNSTDTFLISNIYGPDKTVVYTYYSKLFTIITSVFLIVGTTAWASIKSAFIKHDIVWIKKMSRTLMYLGLAFSIITLLCIFVFQIFINLWLDQFAFGVDYIIVLIFAIHTITSFFVSIISALSNGIQTLKSQLLAYTIGAISKVVITYLIVNIFNNVDWYIIIVIHTLSYIPLLIILPIANNRKMRESERDLLTNHE